MAEFIKNANSGNVDQPTVRLGTTYFVNDGLIFQDKGMYLRYSRHDATPFLDYLETVKAWTPFSQTSTENKVRWHEMGFLQSNLKVASITGGASPTADTVVTISPDSHLQGGTKSPLAQGLEVSVNGARFYIKAKNTSVPNAHTITLAPFVGNLVNPNTIITANSIVVPIGNVSGEGTGYNSTGQRLPVTFETQVGIVKTKKRVTGSEATNMQKVALPSELGGSNFLVYAADIDTVKEHKKEVNNMALFGSGRTYLDTDPNNPSGLLYAPEGLIPQIQRNGNQYPYFGTFTLDTLNDLAKIMTREAAPMMNYLKVGQDVNLAMEDVVSDSLRNGAKVYLDYSAKDFTAGAKEGQRLVDFGFDGFKKGGFTFFKQPMEDFDNPIVGAAPGMNFSYSFVVCPMSYDKDPVSGDRRMTMTLAYKVGQGSKFGFERKFTPNWGGELGPNKDSELDEINFRYLTEFAFVLRGANQAVYGFKADLA